jgi:rfaE bifunctional protein nucleotidyltransferase chain/domain
MRKEHSQPLLPVKLERVAGLRGARHETEPGGLCYHRGMSLERSQPTTRERKVLTLDQAVDRVHELKRQGKRVVFTNGCFDLIHPGHTRYLAEARALGDVLVVAVNSDRTVRLLKGASRPVIPEGERMEMLAALRAVDYVTVFDDPTPREVIARMLPQVLVKGADWGPNAIVGREEVEAAGGEVVSVPLAQGFSTSAIIEKIRAIPDAV